MSVVRANKLYRGLGGLHKTSPGTVFTPYNSEFDVPYSYIHNVDLEFL